MMSNIKYMYFLNSLIKHLILKKIIFLSGTQKRYGVNNFLHYKKYDRKFECMMKTSFVMTKNHPSRSSFLVSNS